MSINLKYLILFKVFFFLSNMFPVPADLFWVWFWIFNENLLFDFYYLQSDFITAKPPIYKSKLSNYHFDFLILNQIIRYKAIKSLCLTCLWTVYLLFEPVNQIKVQLKPQRQRRTLSSDPGGELHAQIDTFNRLHTEGGNRRQHYDWIIKSWVFVQFHRSVLFYFNAELRRGPWGL